MQTSAVAPTLTPSSAATPTNSFTDLGSDDFLKLLITQLTNQDPLKPTGNQELLQQISSIRDIELSTTLTNSLQLLTGQQRFGSATTLIGQFVTSKPNANGQTISGVVTAVRFDGEGKPLLKLGNGVDLPLEQVASIEPPVRAAEALIGQTIKGIDQRDPSNPDVREGQVTAVRAEAGGNVILELDTGEDLRFRDMIGVTAGDA